MMELELIFLFFALGVAYVFWHSDQRSKDRSHDESRNPPQAPNSGRGKEQVSDDGALALRMREMEIERLNKLEADRMLGRGKEQVSDDGALALRMQEMEIERLNDRLLALAMTDDSDAMEETLATKNQEGNSIYRLFFKGFSLVDGGKPVAAAIGGAILDSDGNRLWELKDCVQVPMGKIASQYHAFFEGLHAAHKLGALHIIAYTDSKPLYNHINGYWRMSSKGRYKQVTDLLSRFHSFHLNLSLHGENWPAVNLARMASHNLASTSNATQHCIICMEDVVDKHIFTLKECLHGFCSNCTQQHVETTVTSGRVFPVPCPQIGCGRNFTEDECRSLLSGQILDMFVKRIEEAKIPEAYRIYCPYPDCSYLLDKRSLTIDKVNMKICGSCQRIYCVECRVPWHWGSTCQYYSQLPLEMKYAEDAKLYKLADNQNWRQCKQCRTMIELTEGCYHMTCRCGCEFCYTCGAEYRNKIQTCNCKLWDEHNIIRDEDEDEEDIDSELEYVDSDGSYGFDPPGDEEDSEYEEEQAVWSNYRPPNTYYKTKLCKFFARGLCRFQASCKFAHGEHELRALL